ncbi:MAG: glycine zipper 2TM domain-containing protein [Gammaproteobacteria bacterium]|nr:glycine zipper 2TM domain-containing protein [Gammaproteobacteria bacterium]
MKTITATATSAIAIFAAGLMLASTAQAQTMLVKVLQESDEIVSQIYKEVPVKSCRVEQIPIYGTQSGGAQASTADVVASAIFGGLLGNQVGGGTGKDAATLLGAIAGADMANKKGRDKQVVVGHKQQEVCDVVMQQRTVSQVSGYKTYIEFGDNIWQMTTTIPYTTGEFLRVNVDITPAE